MFGLFKKSDLLFPDIAQLLSLIPGIIGNYIRKEFYKFSLKGCSDNCCISFGTIITFRDIEIGQRAYIGVRCMIGGSIGDDVLIGSNVDILSGKNQHSFESLDKPISQQEQKFENIKIGNGSWVGNSSVVMANIGEGCVIGAGSVVVNDIEDFSIAVGNPAKIIKKRK